MVSRKNNHNNNFEQGDNSSLSSMKQVKKKRKKNENKFRLFLLSVFLLAVVLPFSCSYNVNNLCLRRIKNSNINVPENIEYFKQSEKVFWNNLFLETNSIGDINTKHSIFKQLPKANKMHRLTARIKNLSKNYTLLHPGVFIMDYDTGNYVAINAEEEFPTASIIKIPILYQMYRRKEKGLIDLDEKMSLTRDYVTGGSGYLQYRRLGSKYKYSTLKRYMITESDNSATNMILGSIGGVNDLNNVLRGWGFNKTHMSQWLPDLSGTNVSTPTDIATMLYNINNSDFLSFDSRAEIVEVMSKVKNVNLLKVGLPKKAQLIHKTGDIGLMLGDAGIVILPNGKKYIIVAMVRRPWNSYSAKQFIIELSKITYKSFVTNDL